MPHYHPKKSGGAKEMTLWTENSFKRLKNDVLQSDTDRGSASIADLVAGEKQSPQSLVLAANELKNNLIMPHYQSRKFGWHGVGMHVHPKERNETYTRPALIPEAPTSPIWLRPRNNSVRDVFWLKHKQKNTMIMPPLSIRKILVASKKSLIMNKMFLDHKQMGITRSTNRNPSPILMASWSSKPLPEASILATMGLRIRHKTNSSSIALRAASLMGL